MAYAGRAPRAALHACHMYGTAQTVSAGKRIVPQNS
jgi:hypothetical protein